MDNSDKYKTITLDQYIISSINTYPNIYHSKSYNESKIKVLDHLLNTIGNGISTNEELVESLNVDTSINIKDIIRYISDVKLFSGYTKVVMTNDGFIFPDTSEVKYEGILESEKEKYPDVIKWIEWHYFKHNIYPNFKEDCSIIYRCSDYFLLHPSFITGAIEFYKYCKTWLYENESEYSHAFPKATKRETVKYIEHMKTILINKSYEKISKDYGYGVKFKGDIYQFEINRWEKEKKRIFEFIEKTLDLLLEHLNRNEND